MGNDVTIITVGATMYRALEAADILEQKYGVTADVFDCRSITLWIMNHWSSLFVNWKVLLLGCV